LNSTAAARRGGVRFAAQQIEQARSTRPYDETARVDFPVYSQNTLAENNKSQSRRRVRWGGYDADFT
jgi:hypothetical protein